MDLSDVAAAFNDLPVETSSLEASFSGIPEAGPEDPPELVTHPPELVTHPRN